MSKNGLSGVAFALVIGFLAGTVHAEVTCVATDGSGTCTVTDLGDDEYDVTITATSNGSIWRITAGANGDKIRNILVSPGGTGTDKTRLIIKGPDANPTWLESVDRIDPSSGAESKGLVFIEDMVTNGDVGTITAPRIKFADIGGDLTGGIDMIDPDDTEASIVDLIVGGDVLGDVSVSDGRIDDLTVTGDIGTVASPVTVSCLQTIRDIQAAAIYADITVTGTGTGEGLIRHIETTGGASGDLVGSVTCVEFSAISGSASAVGIFVDDDLDADVTINGDFQHDIDVTDELADEKLIRIAGELGSTGSISVGASGLIGQIIINAADGTDTWVGDVTVGTTTLSPEPYYTQSSASLGGGAVGEALFGFHKTDSEPDWDFTVTSAVPTEVDISHYGPVHRSGISVEGVVTVEKLDNGTWIDVSDDFVVDGTSSHTGFVRVLTVKPKVGKAFENNHEYRIAPVSGKLHSGHVDDCPTSCPDVGWQEDYFQFEIDVT